MRWKRAAIYDKRVYDKRIRRRFLFLPKKIDGDVRWLEMATWKETRGLSWQPTEWLTP